MRHIHRAVGWIFCAIILTTLAPLARGAYPSAPSFDTTQFIVVSSGANQKVYLVSGVLTTNVDNRWIFTSGDWDELVKLNDHGSVFRHRTAPAGPTVNMWYSVDGEFHFPIGVTAGPFYDYATANTLIQFDVAMKPISIANGAGFLINDGTGIFGYVPTNSITGLVQVSSVDIPSGAWTTNGCDTSIAATVTPANFTAATNMGDGIVYYHTNGTTAVTNVARTRFSLPFDWNEGTVKVGIYSVCSGTNSSAATNIVYGVRAAALGPGDNLTNITFGSFQRVVANVGTNAWVQGTEAITSALTVGNTPKNTKGIIWEIQRWGGDASDTETNVTVMVTQVRVYFQRNTRVDFP